MAKKGGYLGPKSPEPHWRAGEAEALEAQNPEILRTGLSTRLPGRGGGSEGFASAASPF